MYRGIVFTTMAKIKRYDKYGDPVYDVSELERYEYGGRRKLYKLPEGGICDSKGSPLGMLDLIGMGISLEEPEQPKDKIGLSDSEIKQRKGETKDENELKELEFREVCNASIRGDAANIIEPMLGALSRLGKRWAGIIGEEKVKRIYGEQEEYFNQLPSEEKIKTKLKSLFGADYHFTVNRRGDVYFVNMIDEDTHACVHFMIRDKKIYTLLDEDEDETKYPELVAIFSEETDSIISMIFGE